MIGSRPSMVCRCRRRAQPCVSPPCPAVPLVGSEISTNPSCEIIVYSLYNHANNDIKKAHQPWTRMRKLHSPRASNHPRTLSRFWKIFEILDQLDMEIISLGRATRGMAWHSKANDAAVLLSSLSNDNMYVPSVAAFPSVKSNLHGRKNRSRGRQQKSDKGEEWDWGIG